MGYYTEFDGSLEITPPLNETEIKYMEKFIDTRRMHRTNGAYFVGGTGEMGQGHDQDIIEYNRPDPSQPSLWCPLEISEDGSRITAVDGKSYYAAEWVDYIINHFVGANPIAKKSNEHFHFLEGHSVDGIIVARGEEMGDFWQMGVFNNKVMVTDVIGLAEPDWKEVNWVGDTPKTTLMIE